MKKEKDTGMAICLILLIAYFFSPYRYFLYGTVATLILVMTVPRVFYYPARFWFGFSELLGSVVSKILLSVIFFLIVVPVALTRKLAGKDSLGLRFVDRKEESFFHDREKTFQADDFEKPY